MQQNSINRVFTNAPWESRVGYCRVLQAGNHIFVTGTAPVADDGSTYAPKDPYRQAKKCLEIISASLAKLNLKMNVITRTRMFVTNMDLWEEFGRAHHEFFADFPPTTTMVEVNKLILPDMMIEIEADGIII